MKRSADRLLTTAFPLSLAVYLLVLYIYFHGNIWDWPYWASEWFSYLTICFPALPAFLLQLLLCRRKTRRWVALLPGAVLLAGVAWFTCEFFTTTGWDNLGWGILLVLSIAPTAGCVLGWIAYGLHRLLRREERPSA